VLRALLDRALSKARDAQNLAVLQSNCARRGGLENWWRNEADAGRDAGDRDGGASSASVLITAKRGPERSCGRTIHNYRRGRRPFVAINCSAIPETLMESEISA